MNNQNNNGCGCNCNHSAPAPSQPADISMKVCDRNANVLPMLQTYTTKVLKPNISSCCKKNILTQQMMGCEGYKYVIKWDFDLDGKTITVPKNCILEFDGGSLKNGTIIYDNTYISASPSTIFTNIVLNGSLVNSYLDVSYFADGNNITEAIRNILTVTNVYIPKGIWEVRDIIDIPSDKTLFGCGVESKLLLSNNSTLRMYKVEKITIKDINIVITTSDDSYGITFAGGVRNCNVSNVVINGSQTWNQQCTCKGILFKEDVTEEYIGNVGIVIENVFIKDVEIGICLDSNTQPSTDYVTSSRFDNVYIDRFSHIGLKIVGTRNFTCNFNGLTIADNFHTSRDHYGIYLDGGYVNAFNNIAIWADARNTIDAHGNQRFQDPTEFYALYIARELQVAGAGHLTGYIEGMIGGVGDFNVFFDRFLYDFYYWNVSSLNNSNLYSGYISNYITNHIPFTSILDFNAVKPSDFSLNSGENISVRKVSSGIEIYHTDDIDGAFNVHFTFDKPLQQGVKYRAFIVYDCEKVSQDDMLVAIRFMEGENTKTYIQGYTRFNNGLVTSSFAGGVELETAGDARFVDISIASSVKSLTIKELYFIEYRNSHIINFVTGLKTLSLINKNVCSIPVQNYPVAPYDGMAITRYFGNKTIPAWYQSTVGKFVESDGATLDVKRSGTFADKPDPSDIYIGFRYFCTDKQTAEGATNGIDIIYKGDNVWVDALGRTIS